MPTVLGCGAAMAIVLGVFEYTGGRFDGYYNRREEDSFEIRERMFKNRRKSLEETIAEVGEGRGALSQFSLPPFSSPTSPSSHAPLIHFGRAGANVRRYPSSRLRGEAAGADQGEVRLRDQPRQRDGRRQRRLIPPPFFSLFLFRACKY